MKANFQKCLKSVLVYEGGYANHPKDPGGATNFGVTQRVYDGYRLGLGKLRQSVLKITQSEVADIYRKQYWNVIQGDALPSGIDMAMMDYAVNSGVARAVKGAQKLVGTRQDGVMGEVTLAAIERADPEKFIIAYCEDRLAFVKRLRTWATFGKGWQRRIMGKRDGFQSNDVGVIDLSIALARGDKDVEATVSVNTGGKADPVDVAIEKTPEGTAGGTGAVGGAGIAATKLGIGSWLMTQFVSLGELAGFTKDQLEPYVYYSQYVEYAFIVLTVVGVLGVVALRVQKQRAGEA